MSKAANFRLSLLQKISGSGVDGGEALSSESARKALEEQILKSESDIDLAKLAQFAIRYSIPSCHRVTVWRLLLGISSPFPPIRSIVAGHRKEEAQLLLKSLRLMQMSPLGRNYGDYHEDATALDLVRMMQLADESLPLVTSVRHQARTKSLVPELLARNMCQICSANSAADIAWIDAYWLTLKLKELLQSVFANNHLLISLIREVQAHARSIQHAVAQNGQNVSDAEKVETRRTDSEELSEPRDEHVELWFRSGGASLLSNEALQKLWDKLCTGDAVAVLLKTVLLELVTAAYWQARSSNTNAHSSYSTFDALVNGCVTREMELKLVARATDTVMKSGLFGSRKQS